MAKGQAQEAQAKSEARQASLEDLLNKKPLSKNVTIYSGDEALTVKVQSIGRKAYSDLVDKHTKTDKVPEIDDEGNEVKHKNGHTKYVEQDVLDEESFLPELVALSATEPELSLENVHHIMDTWNATEFDQLALSAFEVNTQNKIGRLGKG